MTGGGAAMRFRTLTAVLAALLMSVSGIDAVSAEQPESDPITDAERDHWSFHPVSRPVVPRLERDDEQNSIRSPIDAFVLQKLNEADLNLLHRQTG